MGWVISIAFAVVVCSVIVLLGRVLRGSEKQDDKNLGMGMLIAAPIIFALWFGLHTGFSAIHQIDAGNVGVVYQFGAISGQVDEGLKIVAPWKSVRIANIQVQRRVYDQLSAFSEETQDVFVKATLNVRVSPDAIQDLYRNIGPEYLSILVDPRVEQSFKDATVKYKSVDVAPNRETIRQLVRERLSRELAPYSIEVVDLLLDNVDFNPEFKDSIEKKQIATQNALEEEQRVKVAEHRASQVVKTAEGEGAAILAVAEKQAEANRKLSESIDDRLVRYTLVQKLGPNIKVMILPAGQEFILGSDVLASLGDDDGENPTDGNPTASDDLFR